MSLSLYQMSQEWEDVFDKLLDPEIPEEAVFDTIEMIEADMDCKAENYGKIIRSMESDSNQLKDEIQRLQKRKRSLDSRTDMLKQRLFDVMKATGRPEIKTNLFTFSIQGNGGLRPVDLTDVVPAEWLKPGEPDFKRIRESLEAGNELPFATLGERGEGLRIR